MVTQNKRGATEPLRVLEKANEAKFFLERMQEYERPEKGTTIFLYYLSAFLGAFRTTAYRLYGVTESWRGHAAKIGLRDKLKAHPRVGLLISKSNVEIHENGVVIWQSNAISMVPKPKEKWPARAGRFETARWETRWEPRWADVETKLTFQGWQFVGETSNLIEHCREALKELEEIALQNF